MDPAHAEQLLAAYRRDGDLTARNQVVEDHLRSTGPTARRLARGDAELAEDLAQVACLAVVHAAERYRPGHGATFATFVHRTVEGELRRHLRDRTWLLRPPRARQEHYLAVSRARAALTQALGREPTTVEIADETGLEPDEVRWSISAVGARWGDPLEVPAQDGSGGCGELRAEAAVYDAGYVRCEDHEDLHCAFAALEDRERLALTMAFGDELPQHVIAARIGVSQPYASRIIRSALAKLRARMDDGRYAGAGSRR